jgi:phage-related baseplate assembly protein
MSYDFIDIDAEELYNDVTQKLEVAVQEPLYPGDERKIFGEAMVSVILASNAKMNDSAKQRLLRYARRTALDAIGERVGESRLVATSSSTILRLAIQSVLPTNVIIPKGVRITADSEAYFATVKEAVITAGNLHVDVEAKCTTPGSKYNDYPIGSIKTLVDLIPYISSVSNLTISSGGDDGEPYTDDGDNSYRERIRLAPAKFSTAGTESAYEFYAKSADVTVGDVKVFSPTEGVTKIIQLLKDGNIPSVSVIEKVTNVVTDPKIKPLTDHVIVEAPSEVLYDIELHYYVRADDEGDAISNIEGEGGAIDRYIDWQSAALKRDINPDELKKHILSPSWSVNGIGANRAEITLPLYQVIGIDQVARFSGTISVTHEVI